MKQWYYVRWEGGKKEVIQADWDFFRHRPWVYLSEPADSLEELLEREIGWWKGYLLFYTIPIIVTLLLIIIALLLR